jgi:hypothetical protein
VAKNPVDEKRGAGFLMVISPRAGLLRPCPKRGMRFDAVMAGKNGGLLFDHPHHGLG